MAIVNFFLQGKGGVGKSFSCTMYAQYLLDGGVGMDADGKPAIGLRGQKQPICIDIDPTNATLSSYPALKAHRINILDDDKRIDPLKFDELIELITKARPEDIVMVDNGSSSFLEFSEFLLTNDVPSFLAAEGHTVYIHTVVIGGEAQGETVNGFYALAKNFYEPTGIFVWLNPYFGQIVKDGKSFEEFKAYKAHAARVRGIIRLPNLRKDTFGTNLTEMMKAHQTFAEAVDSPAYSVMARHRFNLIRIQTYTQIAACPEL